MKKLPIQPAGWVVFGVGLTALLGALVLNWRELLVLACGCGVILLLSLPFVVGRSEIRLTRIMAADRVSIDDDALIEIHAENTGSVRTSRQIINEAINGQPVPVPLPGLAPGVDRTVVWRPSTEHRGRFILGPAKITKSDPCRLMQRDVGQTGRDEFWVQPRVMLLPSLIGGLTKDMDGPTFDHSPAGDVAFHAVRPYRAGDDIRHVHWMATARAGEMMVRQYVDNRQPFASVVVDAATGNWASSKEFDTGLDIAASVALSAVEDGHPVSVHVGRTQMIGSNRRVTRQRLLDDLTLVQPDEDFRLEARVGSLVAVERNASIAIVVVGTNTKVEPLRNPIGDLGNSYSVLVVQVGADPNPDLATLAGRGVRYVEVASIDEFRKAFSRRAVSA